jgi:hypothetical protein
LIALNNLFVDTTTIALNRVDDSSIAAFNLFFGNGQDVSESNVDMTSSIFQDPFFDANDVITSLSPAVDAGIAFYEHNAEVVLEIPASAFNGAALDMGHVETDGMSTNQAPIVDVGQDQAIVFPDNVNINATVTDDGLPVPSNLTVSWTQESGPNATIFSPDAEDTEISFSTEGIYVFRLTANDSALSAFDEVTINVTSDGGSTTTILIPINAGNDDVEEKSSETVIIGSTDLDLVRSGGDQTVGLRFNGLNIPPGTEIVNAYIQFTAKGIRSEATTLTLKGEAVGNAASFVKVNANVSSRPTTTSSVSWSPLEWAVIGEAGDNQKTPPITSIIQEIVDHPDWASNNSAAIIISGTGKRDAYSFEGNQSAAPVLHVEFGEVTGNQQPTASISTPVDGANFTLGDNISFTGTGTDLEDGDVTTSLTWDSNLDGQIGTGASFSITALSQGTHMITATATDSGSLTGDDTISITVSVDPVGGNTTTISIPITLDTDDAEEKPDGKVILRSTDLDLVASGGNQTIGMRFNGVAIPQGAIIVDAFIQFTASHAGSSATSLVLEGEQADNAATFLNNSNANISSRPRTTNNVSWSPATWSTVGEAGVDQRTPNLASIIQEIVNRANWVSSNSLVMIVTGSGKREAISFEANASTAAVLHLEFE